MQFNYASSLVEGITLSALDTSLSLDASLDTLSEKTDLNFVIISDKTISVKLKSIMFCGYLKDKDTGEALPYVTVENGTTATIANEEGYFELKGLRKNDLITIKHLGFKPLIRQIQYFNTSNCSTLYLVPHQEKLAEVIVYDFLIRGIDQLNNGAVQLDFERFNILPGLVDDDVLQSVQALPGVMSIDETVSNINIRGGSNDQNYISWDGIKMYQSGHFFGLISMYNPEITQKVELRKNGSSASETDGVSGTIAMKTDEYLNSSLKASLGANLIDVNGSADAPLGKKASLQVAARKSISDFVETPTYANYFDRISQETEIDRNSGTVTNSDISFDFYDAAFRLLFNPSEKDRIRLNFIHTANQVTFNESAEVEDEEVIRDSNLSQTSIAAGIYHKRFWTEKFITEFSVYNTDYKLKAINANILEDQRFLQENKVSETGVKFLARNRLDSQFSWTNGYHFIETKVTNLDDVDDPRFLRLEGEVLRTHSVFTEMGFSSKNSATQMNLGLRFNHLDDFDKQLWEPRLSFNQRLGKHLNLEALGEFKHQSTSQIINFQNDFLGIEKRRWQLSNDGAIPVITSKQASLGLNYKKSSWLINAISFVKRVEGITTQSQGFQGPFEFVRTSGAYDALGFDLLLRKQFQDNNAFWISYSYLNSTYLFEQLPETTFPNNFDITHGLTAGINYHLGRVLLAAGLNWRTGRPFTAPEANNELENGEINYSGVNANRLKDYLRLDISANYQFNWGKNNKAQIGASIWNLLDQNNTLNTFYRITSQEEVQKIGQSSLGLTPNLSIKFFFD
ncbi:TonB-dependent receptor [Maribacter aestuarii]|uniref:TonB-dependent receptor n=1 Tax=Maribacter aestuarii TaxID=1130723 RepID=UPI00248BA6FE|nr:carboxypeptidase-like regulatory domain-containing protein [Maribacter aestuarii]